MSLIINPGRVWLDSSHKTRLIISIAGCPVILLRSPTGSGSRGEWLLHLLACFEQVGCSLLGWMWCGPKGGEVPFSPPLCLQEASDEDGDDGGDGGDDDGDDDGEGVGIRRQQ